MTKKDGIIALIAFTLATILVGGTAYALNQSSKEIVLFDSIPGFAVGNVDTSSDEPEESLAILLLGVGGDNHDGGTLTDTIMVAEISPEDRAVKLVSLPRDFLVFDEEGFYYKINAFYPNREKEVGPEQAMQELKYKVAEITGIQTDHYAQIDFGGFTELIDTIGGVEVEVTERIDDQRYPGPNYSYEPFIIEEGTQILDGETALKYARSRYSSEGGDLDRARRQQQIVSGVQTTLFDFNPIWDIGKITSLISLAHQNLDTDLSLTAMRQLYDTYRGIDDYQLVSLVVGSDLLQGSLLEGFRQFGSTRGYILEPRAGEDNYLQIREEVDNILRQEEYFTQVDNVRAEKSSVLVVSSIPRDESQQIIGLLEARGMVPELLSSQSVVTGSNPQGSTGLYVTPQSTKDQSLSEVQSDSEVYLLDAFGASIMQSDDPRILSTHLAQKTDYILYLSEK